MASNAKRLLTAEEFLMIEWEDSDAKAELDNGIVRMMAGGSAAHARVQRNILVALHTHLRGTGCSAYGSDMASRTHDLSVRYPDVTVFCGHDRPEDDGAKSFDDPKMIVEVLSPTTRNRDERVKLNEYMAMPSLEAILYVDPDDESLRLLTRTRARGWNDGVLSKDESVRVEALGLTLSAADIFARD